MLKLTDKNKRIVKAVITVLTALVTMFVCLRPMDNLPKWNGQDPGHRNQYELMAEAILDGRVHFEYGDEAELEKLQNPYDPKEREESGVAYHWDHAYYNGRYYMYFGIVPVFLAFLPYRVITGSALTTFRATQFFTVIIIAGIFALFYLLRKLFFKKFNFLLYLVLSSVLSVVSVWYASAEPALYCTAITAGIALEIWSIFFFVLAVYVEKRENRQILLAAIGALLGALVFGCRPPVALANIIVIPLVIVFFKQRNFSWKLVGKLALAALPYLVVGAALMIYNYVRFDNPLEFGQAYQLTVADQTSYDFSVSGIQLLRIFSETLGNFFAFKKITEAFPYLQSSSVFFHFPIFFFTVAALFPPVRDRAKKTKCQPFIIGLIVSVFVITAFQVLWSPYLLERYRMDIYFLMSIIAFMTFGLWYEESERKKGLAVTICVLSVMALVSVFLIYVRTIGVYYPERMVDFANMLGLK